MSETNSKRLDVPSKILERETVEREFQRHSLWDLELQRGSLNGRSTSPRR
jgi:hypothetical protein